MQADTFVDERMKVLYALSFMCGGTAQVWAVNETMAVVTGTSQMQTLDIFLESVEKTFGDLDQAWMAHAQLHELKMTPGTTADDYMAQFEMLVGRTGFNDVALEDIYIHSGPSQFDPAEDFCTGDPPQQLGSMEDSGPKSRPPPSAPYRVEAVHRPDEPECRTHESNGWPGQTTGCHYRQSVHTHCA